jgi:hypothetical protein
VRTRIRDPNHHLSSGCAKSQRDTAALNGFDLEIAAIHRECLARHALATERHPDAAADAVILQFGLQVRVVVGDRETEYRAGRGATLNSETELRCGKQPRDEALRSRDPRVVHRPHGGHYS